jgi:hypothetical protein
MGVSSDSERWGRRHPGSRRGAMIHDGFNPLLCREVPNAAAPESGCDGQHIGRCGQFDKHQS